MGQIYQIGENAGMFPGDKNGDRTLDAKEASALLKAPTDNLLKAFIMAQNNDTSAAVTERGLCLIENSTKDIPTIGIALKAFTGYSKPKYQEALNLYLNKVKTGDGDQKQHLAEALQKKGIGSIDDFANLDHIELPGNFCSIKKNLGVSKP